MIQDQDTPITETPPFRMGPWIVDPASCELKNGDRVIRLRPKVMDLLAVLARNPDQVLTKQC
ncbi:MAG: hypothetical protein V2I67_07195, partial [Thermoanaerobaculales bacterium]|nr:hypothetical protein [Thermoanaerobaculales bacterium]